MTDQRQREFGRLLGKATLTPLERGKLASLKRDATPAEQEQADAKIASAGGMTTKQAGEEIAKGIGRVLNDEGR
jgi:hypothetical protein